ncbi:MAG: Leucine-rich repeat (LRR) protein [Cyclobacteriaceae bacterium]
MLAIYAHDNKLTSLPQSLSELSKLEIIRFDNNYISEFPIQLLNLKNLTYIDFSKTDVAILPKEIVDYQKLELLVFDGYRIDTADPLNENYDSVMKQLHERGVILNVTNEAP